ncbi:hypothetical protein ACFQH6_16150 [Halobacteriaceae archaeon GCM10025711]
MSTNTHPPEPRPATDARTTTPPTESQRSDSTPTDTESAAAWVARCQRQFDPARSDRLHNLVDEANHAMPGAESLRADD